MVHPDVQYMLVAHSECWVKFISS